MKTIVVIGAGQAGLQVADSLRREDFEGRVVLAGAEPSLPYQRPPLSKKFLTGDMAAERLLMRQQSFFDERGIETLVGTPVDHLDIANRTLKVGDETIRWDGIAFCTGTVVNQLPVDGTGLAGVHYLRTLADTTAIAAELPTVGTATVIGGGFIGLEVAASLRKLGKDVTVIEAQSRLMERAVTPVISEFFRELHETNGTEILLDARVERIVGGDDGRVGGVRLADGRTVDAELVVIGIGVHAETELARDAGLECEDGIIVDEFAVTSEPAIVAAGDCARFPCIYSSGLIRLESVQNAMDQAKVAAATLAGKPVAYDAVPWFWSDQYDKKLQMAGLPAGYSTSVQRGNTGDGKFSIFYFDEAGVLVGVDSVNDPLSHMASRKLIEARTVLDPADAANPQFVLKSALG